MNICSCPTRGNKLIFFIHSSPSSIFTNIILELGSWFKCPQQQEETERIREMFKGLLYIIHDCHFQGNINTNISAS